MTVRFSTVVSLVLILICVNTSFAVQTQIHESSANVSSSSIAIIGKVEVRVQSHGLAIEIPVTAPIVPQDSQLTPDRLVFDFPGFQLQGQRGAANKRLQPAGQSQSPEAARSAGFGRQGRSRRS